MVSFCWLFWEILMLFCYEVICDLEFIMEWIEMLLMEMDVLLFEGKKFVFVLILCVGNGFFEGMLELVFVVCVLYIGVYCDYEML